MKKTFLYISSAIIFIAAFYSCKQNDNPISTSHKKIGQNVLINKSIKPINLTGQVNSNSNNKNLLVFNQEKGHDKSLGKTTINSIVTNGKYDVDHGIAIDDEGNVADDEDGIKDAQEMEFELTKDVKLGYVPKYRLIAATEQLKTAKLNGNYSYRTDALTWTERGPNIDVTGPTNGNTRAGNGATSGRMRAIWVDLADPTNKTVWVGGIDGGIWKTNDITASPATWTLVNDFFGNLAIGSICQDPSSPNIMYFGTGEKAINVDAVRGGGIWKSTDHGVTWNLLLSSTALYNVSKIICDAAGNVYVATQSTNNQGIQRSSDGGNTWTNITPATLNLSVTDMKLSSTGRMHIVCGYYNGYFNSNPAGYRFTDNPSTVTPATWTAPTTAFPNVQYNVELAVCNDTLYALPSNSSFQTPNVYKSTDGGNNWAATATSPPAASGTFDLSSGQAWYNIALAVDPNNSNNVIAGGLNCYKTTNGGTTWTEVSTWVGPTLSYVHADQHTAVWAGNQVLVGSDGGIFYSADGGSTFSDRNTGLRLKQFYSCAIHPTTTNYFLGGAQDNGCHQLTNPGLGGSIEVTGGDGAFTHIDQDEPQYQFGSYVYSTYRRSTDGGATWSNIDYSSSIGQFINPTDYDNGNNKIYASGSAGQYVRWENPQTGATFTPVTISAFSSSTVRSVLVSPYTSNRVFFGTAAGKVVRVDNANAATPTGTDISGTGMPSTIVSCVATGTTDNYMLATYSNYGSAHVWMSSTGGGTSGWTNISGNLPDIPVRWAMFYPYDNTKAILATEMGIYETSLINGSSTVWVQNSSFPIVRTDMLQYRPADGTVAAATHGRGLWTAVIPFTVPYIHPANSLYYLTRSEKTTNTLGCRNYTDYTVNMNIDMPPTGDATVNLSLAGGATATQGVDFDFTTNGDFTSPSSTITFANGSTASKTITIRVYDDAEVENIESFTLNYSVSGTTNAQISPSGSSFTFNISDNDVAPVAPFSGSYTVGSYTVNVSTATPFRSNLQRFRLQNLYTAAELKAAGLISGGKINSLNLRVATKNSTKPFTGFTISIANTSASTVGSGYVSETLTPVYSANYSTVLGDNTFNFTTPFTWDGVSNISIQYCFDNGIGAVDALADVTEGSNPSFGSNYPTVYSTITTGSGCSLAATNISTSRVNATFNANGGSTIETVAGNNKVENVASTGTFYFYSGATGNLINSLSGASAPLGCVTSSVFEAGNIWQTFYGGQRSQKVIDITPTTNSGASYIVGLYYTTAELGGLTPSGLQIAHSSAATMSAVTSANTTISPTSVIPFGNGYLFTAPFTGFSKYFLTSNTVMWTGATNTDWNTASNWSVNRVPNSSDYEIIIPSGTPNMPLVTSTQTANNLTIQAGATVTVTSPGILQVAATLQNNGIITGTGNTVMNGAFAQSIIGIGTVSNFTSSNNSTVTISSGSNMVNLTGVLTLTAGTFATNNNLTLKSTSAATATIGNSTTATITGNITIERYISNKRAWRLLGVPYSSSTQTIKQSWMENGSSAAGYGTQITTFTGDGNAANYDAARPASSIRTYSADNFNSDAAHTPNTTNLITANPAYFLFVRGDRSVDRTIAGSASSSTTLRTTGLVRQGSITAGVAGTQFSLILNPYPSLIDFDAIKSIAANSAITTFYVWDATMGTVGQYRTVTISGSSAPYTYTATPGTADNSWRFIESGTAFFVPSPTTTVSFTEATKTSSTPPSSMLRTASANETQLAINLNIVNADNTISLADGVREVFDNSYATTVDNNDAKKLEGFNENLGINSNSEVLAVEKRPLPVADDVIALKLWNTATGNYQFEIQPANISPSQLPLTYLHDNYLNSYTPVDLTNVTTINFSVTSDAASAATNRFSIVFSKVQLNIPAIVIYPNPVQNGFVKLQLNNMPKGTYLVRLVNNLGQVILTREINHAEGTSTETINTQKVKGTFMLEVTKPDNTKSVNKLIIN